MTDKKEKILASALELFAHEGYDATSTSKIGRKAGVSEGLIFRHFKNKKGLLDALMDDAEQKMGKLFVPILNTDDPKDVIRKSLDLPFVVDKGEYNFWRLQFKLKWETEYNNPNKMKPLLDKLEWAFTELGYTEPTKEAELINLILDAVSTELLRDNIQKPQDFKSFLMKKYSL